MKNRILAFLTAFTLLLSLLSLSAAAADTELRIIGPTEAPAVGEEFTVTVELRGNPGIMTFQAMLLYDNNQLECTQVEPGPVIEDMMHASNPYKASPGGAMIAAAGLGLQKEDGVAVTFHFMVIAEEATVPRTLAEVRFSGENRLPYAFTVVQLGEDGTDLTIPTDDPGTDTGTGSDSEAGSGTGSTDTGAGNTDTGSTGTGSTGTGSTDTGSTGTGGSSETGSGTPSGAGESGGKTDEGSGSEETGTTGGETEQPETPTETEVTFPDVPADKWYADYVGKAAAKGWFTGFADGSFRPAGKVTRAQFVTVLWRMAGKPAPTQTGVFTDVPTGAWYADAVDWAYEMGYVNGRTTEPMTFDPSGSITRQEAMKILFLYSGGVSGMEAMLTGIYDGDFADSGDIASWAKPAMYWGYYNGILNGKSTTTLAPVDTATRAELAKILVVYDEKM